MQRTLGLLLFTGIATAGFPRPFVTSSPAAHEYRFDWPIRRVAIIGAGPSGMVTYRELTEVGLDVRIFERDNVPGGNWHYTEEVPLDAPVPNAPASIGGFVPSLPPDGVDLPYSEELGDDADGQIWRDHRGPKPVWESLMSNMPSPVQQFSQWPWPVGTQWEISHYQMRNYVRSYASYLHINSNDENPAVAYNTRVEHVEKRVNQAGQEHGWRLWLRSLQRTHRDTLRATWWTEDFDAVVVAVGKYNAPSMPSIPGLGEWVQRFPDHVHHSRQYRRPEAYANQTMLIIGAATSGAGISRDLNPHVKQIYQSIRSHDDNKPHVSRRNEVRGVPRNTTLVGEIKRFLPISDEFSIRHGLVELKNGTILSGIDSVILATGYRFSFPFLPQYYDGASYVPHADSATTVSPFLPLNGSYIRDLYLDLFYMRDPTLAIVGLVSSYASLDYMALALAKVWTETAKLPNSQTMQSWCEKAVEERGYGKYFFFNQEISAFFTYLGGWLNEAAAKYGGKQVDGPPKYSKEVAHYWRIARHGLQEDEVALASFGVDVDW